MATNTGASSNTGLKNAKLRAARRTLLQAEVDIDNDPMFMAITAKQHDDLLNEAQAISLNYNSTPVLVDGHIKSFMGFNFIHSERIPGAPSYNAAINPALSVPAGQNWIPFWAKSGVCLGKWNEVEFRPSIRNDKNDAQQLLLRMTREPSGRERAAIWKAGRELQRRISGKGKAAGVIPLKIALGGCRRCPGGKSVGPPPFDAQRRAAASG